MPNPPTPTNVRYVLGAPSSSKDPNWPIIDNHTGEPIKYVPSFSAAQDMADAMNRSDEMHRKLRERFEDEPKP